MPRTISPELLRQRLADGAPTLIDTRTEDSFDSWHIPGARHYPYETGDAVDVEGIAAEFGIDEDDEIITICGIGKSSTAFANALEADGFGTVDVVQNGMRGWSQLYEVAAIPTVATTLEIFQIQRVAKGCLGYVVGSPSSGEAVVIDPTRHIDEFLRVAEDDGMEITRVIDTHVHADHLTGGPSLADETGATYHLPARASERDVTLAYTPLERNEVLEIGDVELKAIRTPGHTIESMSLLLGGEAVITADTLFVDGVGRTELQYGDAEAAIGAQELYRSIHHTLLAFPDGVTLLPGHFDSEEPDALNRMGQPISTNVHAARTELPVIQLEEDDFVDRIVSNLPEKPPNFERIVAINSGVEANPDDGEATELELGPNRCAAATS